MKNLFDHIDYVKRQPHHVRKNVAFGVAYGVAGLAAVMWLGASLTSGAFAIQGSSFASATGGAAPSAPAIAPNALQVAGAAAAVSDSSGVARIEIVDATTTPPVKEQTVIPF